MDQLSSLYVRMASGANSQLHSPASVMGFVDQMQSRIDKSSVPRKTFFIDSCTPHSDTVIAESSALKPSVGWVTLKVTEGIRRGIHEWGIKIEHQGESNDESGLMIGIVPKNFTKFDTFISQGGGWCLSRAGKFYGHWRRNTSAGNNTLTFGTGDRVVLTLDYEAAVMTVRVGEELVVGDLSGLTMEVFPAISLHYRHQHVRFEHHTVRETASQRAPWLQRQVLPLAPVYMPLTPQEMQSLPLDSYLFSPLFQHQLTLESSSAITMEEEAGQLGGAASLSGAPLPAAASTASLHLQQQQPQEDGSEVGGPQTRGARPSSSSSLPSPSEQRAMRLYLSAEASAARLTVLARAFAGVRRYVAVVPGKTSFLAPHVTAEYLRHRLYEAARESVSRGNGSGGGGGYTNSLAQSTTTLFTRTDTPDGRGSLRGGGGGGGCDAALNCGAIIVVHLFMRAISTGQEMALPLVLSFRDYVVSLPMYSLVEGGVGRHGVGSSSSSSSSGGWSVPGSSVGSALAPDTVQLAVDRIVSLLDSASAAVDGQHASSASASGSAAASGVSASRQGTATVSAVTGALMEVAVLLALQRGLVSEVLRVCRHLLRLPGQTLSAAMVEWLRRHAAGLLPRQPIPDIDRALMRACVDPTCFRPTLIEPATVVLSVAYGLGSSLYVHTADGLARWGPSTTSTYVLLADTRQPAAYCCGAAQSSMAATHSHVLLLSDRMAADEVALVLFSLQLDTHQVLRWADVHSTWPRSPQARPQLATKSEDGVLLVYERGSPAAATRTTNGAAASTGTPASAVAGGGGGLPRRAAAAASSSPSLPSASAGWELVVHSYSAATVSALCGAPLWTRTLTPPPLTASGVHLDRCLLLRKPSLVDLGDPEALLTVAGGNVSVELWVQFLDKEDGAVLYQHGDRSTNGEVFLELIKSEGSYCIRGGYRHGVRGSCLVAAPLPPTADSRPLHVALVFDGQWRLYFDGEAVAGNRHGPHVSLDAPKQRWTVGSGCTCLLTGLRVWRLGRTARELSRDYQRPLLGDEPGLVAQFLFNERNGNVAFNYVQHVKAVHARCDGAYARVGCDSHPWRSYAASPHAAAGSGGTAGSGVTAAAGGAGGHYGAASPFFGGALACARLHEWRDLTLTTCCVARQTLVLSTPFGESGPYASKHSGHVFMFFDLDSGAAHRSLLLITNRSPVRSLMRADPAGQLWEVFEVDAGLVKGELESSYLLSLLSTTGGGTAQQQQQQRPRERVLAVVPLPLEDDNGDGAERLRAFADDGAARAGDERPSARPLDEAASLSHSTTQALRSGTHTVSQGPSTMVAGDSSLSGAPSDAEQSFTQLASFTALLAQPAPSVSYVDVAMWLLRLIAAHADADAAGGDQALFTPLADDVSLRCVTEVRALLGEHVRVVRANNARRAVTLKGASSWAVVAASLRVLLRLIRRARAFGLHPGPLGLTVVKDSGSDGAAPRSLSTPSTAAAAAVVGTASAPASSGANTEVTMALLLRELHTSSLRRRTAPSMARQRPASTDAVPTAAAGQAGAGGHHPTVSTSAAAAAPLVSDDAADTADSSTLLGLLADVLNEEGLTLSPEIVALARTVTIEGVGLFLPDVAQRAKLLRDLLVHGSTAPGSATAAATPPRAVVRPLGTLASGDSSSRSAVLPPRPTSMDSPQDERVPAMGVLLEAVAQSFATVLAAAPLLCVKDGVASLTEVCDTLRTLLDDSAAQWRRRWSPLSGGPPRAAHATQAFTRSLSEAVASLQLLLLSACQGNRWEATLNQLHTNSSSGGGSGEGHGAHTGSGGGHGGDDAAPAVSAPVFAGSVGGVEGVVAAALDVQRLCFSQAATYHPCVRLYYTALFHNAEACLSLCVQRAEESSTAAAAAGAVPLAAMVASLAPTFVAAPLHTALSAVPLMLTVEDGEWFLAELRGLLSLVTQLLEALPLSHTSAQQQQPTAYVDDDTVEMSGGASVAAARQLLLSLRGALHYASVWVATFLFSSSAVSSASVREEALRERLGLASVTATPTAQRTVAKLTATLDDGQYGSDGRRGSSAGGQLRGPADEAAAAEVWENTLLEGGLWAEQRVARTPTPSHRTSKTAATRRSPRAARMDEIVQNSPHWSAVQAKLDPLAARASASLSPLITMMAAAALHLSALPVEAMSAAEVEQAMGEVLRRISRPVRTELLSRREGDASEEGEGGGTSPSAAASAARAGSLSPGSPSQRHGGFEAMVRELQQRCSLLLGVRSCTELWSVDDALFISLPTTDETSDTESVRCDTKDESVTSAAAGRALWSAYRRRRLRYRAHIATRPDCTLSAAVQLVKHVILSRDFSAASLLAALCQRERLAALRRTGLEHLLALVREVPCSAESVAQLLSSQGRGPYSHYETGIRGAAYGEVTQIRGLLYSLLRAALESAPPTLPPSWAGNGTLSLASSASVVCGLLDRAWQPRELAFFVHVRMVPTLLERYVTLFIPASAKKDEGVADQDGGVSPHAGQAAGDGESAALSAAGARRPSHVPGSGPAATARRPQSLVSDAARLCSIEVRQVSLMERRHRDQVMAAQQARRSSKSALVTAAVLNRQSAAVTDGRPSVAGNGGGHDSAPVYTAGEFMQAKVWLTIKHLLLQAVTMLTPQRLPALSRVEAAAVMAFVADALAAMGGELQRCRDVLARAVEETPVLLAQAGNAAVMEPLVTVQDQVDVLCSVLAVVAGTLSTASLNVDVTVPAKANASAVRTNSGNGADTRSDGEDAFLSAGLSAACADVANTLLELVFLDLHHARAVRAEGGVGCVVRDAAACARMAGLLLCRCQPATVRRRQQQARTPAAWAVMYASPVFTAAAAATTGPLAAPASPREGHPALQLWVDLGTYAVATSGLSRTAQHVLVALRRLLRQPAWAAELRSFATGYSRLVQTYVRAVQRQWARHETITADDDGGAFADESTLLRRGGSGSGRVRQLALVRLTVWGAALGGRLLAPPAELGTLVSLVDERDGAQSTLAYVVDLDATTNTAAAPSAAAAASTPSAALTGGAALPARHIRGSSHAPSKVAAAMVADGEHVRSVVVVPADAEGCPGGEELSVSPQQLFLPSDSAAAAGVPATVVPPYAHLVDHFLLPAVEQCLPLLSATASGAAGAFLTTAELSYVVSLVQLTAGAARSRPELGRTLVERGAMRLIHQHALRGTVRLPFPLKIMREWAALVSARAAEDLAERVYASGGGSQHSDIDEEEEEEQALSPSGSGARRHTIITQQQQPKGGGAPATTTSMPTPHTRTPPPLATANSGSSSNNNGGGPSVRTSLTPLAEVFSEVTRGSGGGNVGGPFPPLSTLSAQDTPQTLDWNFSTEESLVRLAERLGFIPRSSFLSGGSGAAGGGGSISSPSGGGGIRSNAGALLTAMNVGGSRGGADALHGSTFRNPLMGSAASAAASSARLSPPRADADAAGAGSAMFLSFPMWDAHLSRAAVFSQPQVWAHTPAALTITPATPRGRFPVWEDGYTVELAVLLSNGDVYPAVGDAMAIPCSSAHMAPSDYVEETLDPDCPSPFEFPLLRLIAADPAAEGTKAFTLLQLTVHRTCLSVTLNLPRSAQAAGREAGGRPGREAMETHTATKALRQEDWHRCMHVSLVCTATAVVLCRGGETVNIGLPSDAARRLEALLRQEGVVQSVLVGRESESPVEEGVAAAAAGVAAVDGPMALVAGLRLSGTSLLRTSVRVAAELVARDHALPPLGLPELLCAFDLRDGSGATIHSVDGAKQFRGVLSGRARWAVEHLPLGFYPAIELNTGRPRSGVAGVPASAVRLPRPAMAALVESLSPVHFRRFSADVLHSLLTLSARHAVVAALEVGVSPAYALEAPAGLLVGTPPPLSAPQHQQPQMGVFDPRHVLDETQAIPAQLLRLFEFDDGGCLPDASAQLIHDVVQHLLVAMTSRTAAGVKSEGMDTNIDAASAKKPLSAASAKTTAATAVAATPASPLVSTASASSSAAGNQENAPLCRLFRDAASLLRQLRRDDAEVFLMEVPASLSKPPAAVATPAVLPLAFVNGGTGSVTFDAKYRNLEQATFYKDRELKNVLVKYPDGQGGWPLCVLSPADAPWTFLRSVPTSAGHRATLDSSASGSGGSVTASLITVTVKSLRAAVMHAVLRAMCDGLLSTANAVPSSLSRVERAGDDEVEAAAACLLDGRVVAHLLRHSSARSIDDDCVHFAGMLTRIFELWRRLPHLRPHDQVPLSMAMAHLNSPLRGVMHNGNAEVDLGALLSASLGTFSPYVQSLLALWSSAMLLDSAWAGCTYAQQLQARWRRLLRTWCRAAVHCPHASLSSLADGKGDEEEKGRFLGEEKKGRRLARQQLQQHASRSVGDGATHPSDSSATSSSSSSLSLSASCTESDRAALRSALQRSQPPTDPSRATPAQSCGGKAEARWKDGYAQEKHEPLSPCPVLLLPLAPASPLSASLPPTPSASAAATQRDGAAGGTAAVRGADARISSSPLRAPYPTGVTRKGNGLWVVKGAGLSAGDGVSISARDEALRSGATAVRSSVGFHTGAVYWEVYVTSISRAEAPAPLAGSGATLASNILLGVATEYYEPTVVPTGPDGAGVFIGNDAESWAFDGGRALRYYKGYTLESSPRTKWKQDDVIGIVLDISSNRLCCLHNGRLVSEFNGSFLSQQQRAAEAAVFPVVICTGAASCEVNFGSSAFVSMPPPGCLPVDPTIFLNEESSRVWQLAISQELATPSGGAVKADRGAAPSGVLSPADAISRAVLTHEALPFICRRLASFTQGRRGPLDVTLLCPDGAAKTLAGREVKTDKEASLVLGSACVTSGKWYFEVVAPLEPTFSVGWYARRQLEEHGAAAGRGTGADGALAATPASGTALPQLGHDAHSWALDASRMTARHDRHHVSLSRRLWKAGDVVGCLLDCEAGTMAFTVNGRPLSAAHGGSGAVPSGSRSPAPQPQQLPSSRRGSVTNSPGSGGPVGHGEPLVSPSPPSAAAAAGSAVASAPSPSSLFSGISVASLGGLVPVLLLEPRTTLVVLWSADDLLYPPQDGDYQALGGGHAVRAALTEMITTPASKERAGAVGGPPPPLRLRLSALQKLLYHASKVQELHPNSLRSYLIPPLFPIVPADGAAPLVATAEGQRDPPLPSRELCAVSGLDATQLPGHLTALLLFAHFTAVLFPVAHPAALPVSVEDSAMAVGWAQSPLHHALRVYRAVAPAWTGLRMLQLSLDSSNGAGDAVRLSVNRRKALLVARDAAASLVRRMRDSLFGQVYQLLVAKTPALFLTNKKMWAVTFYGEGADDVGGPYRECLAQMCAELMSPSLRLFLPAANALSEMGEVREGFVLNPACTPPTELLMYRFLGRLMGGCMRGGEPLSLYLPSSLWKCLVGEAADDADLARTDVATLHALEYVERVAGLGQSAAGSRENAERDDEEDEEAKNAELAELCPGGFSLLNDAGVVVPLVPNGANIVVTVRNAALYVRLVREYKLHGSGAAQRRALQRGFHEVVPLSMLMGLKWYELEELVCGQCDYDPDALLDTARYDGMELTDTRVQQLREVLRGFTRHQRALFMRFVSGRERLPPGTHLKIMPDTQSPSPAPLPPRSPSARQQTGMTPQPPSTPNVGSSGTEQGAAGSGGGGGGASGRSGSFVRHSTLTQSRSHGGVSAEAGGQQQQPLGSPPQLGFTPPPAQPVSLPHQQQSRRHSPSPQLRLTRELLASADGGSASAATTATATTQRRLPNSHHERAWRDADEGFDDARLPHASTCFYWLRLPRYSTAAVMAERLLFAIEQCVDIDADFRVHDADVTEQEGGPTLARVSSDDNDLFEDFSHLR